LNFVIRANKSNWIIRKL